MNRFIMLAAAGLLGIAFSTNDVWAQKEGRRRQPFQLVEQSFLGLFQLVERPFVELLQFIEQSLFESSTVRWRLLHPAIRQWFL